MGVLSSMPTRISNPIVAGPKKVLSWLTCGLPLQMLSEHDFIQGTEFGVGDVAVGSTL